MAARRALTSARASKRGERLLWLEMLGPAIGSEASVVTSFGATSSLLPTPLVRRWLKCSTGPFIDPLRRMSFRARVRRRKSVCTPQPCSAALYGEIFVVGLNTSVSRRFRKSGRDRSPTSSGLSASRSQRAHFCRQCPRRVAEPSPEVPDRGGQRSKLGTQSGGKRCTGQRVNLGRSQACVAPQ
jgi:hypothetical protein